MLCDLTHCRDFWHTIVQTDVQLFLSEKAAREQSERVTASHLVVRLPAGPLLIHSLPLSLGFLVVKFRLEREISARMKDDGEAGEQHIRNRVCEQTQGGKSGASWGRCEWTGDGWASQNFASKPQWRPLNVNIQSENHDSEKSGNLFSFRLMCFTVWSSSSLLTVVVDITYTAECEKPAQTHRRSLRFRDVAVLKVYFL